MTESDPYPESSEPRLAQMLDWLAEQDLPFECQPKTIRAASSDASFRRYFRIDSVSQGSLILMDAPPPLEDCTPFVWAAEILADAGLRVPAIFAKDLKNGFLLLSDLGNKTLLDELRENPACADTRYRQATGELVKLQLATRPNVFAPYDRSRLMQEIRLFDDWYVRKHKQVKLNTADRGVLDQAFETIVSANLSEPRVFVHRDYHSRNLVADGSEGPLGVLDFQDALTGPISYDLVSLLRDAYISWPEEQVLDWAIRYWEAARAAGLPVADDFGQFWRNFELMGIQRHLKVLGIFSRLHYRDNKSHYLADLPLVLRYTVEAVNRYESLQAFAKLLERIEGVERVSGHTF